MGRLNPLAEEFVPSQAWRRGAAIGPPDGLRASASPWAAPTGFPVSPALDNSDLHLMPFDLAELPAEVRMGSSTMQGDCVCGMSAVDCGQGSESAHIDKALPGLRGLPGLRSLQPWSHSWPA